ncbi:GPP34 family phosphoprotein [Saccharopolyspora rhizosphaerae]|uniref:GPP34 family phosphoprotein n=1 Tax=Saccharopolyspora rhizosphaerae TaxID=2492662 RepID=A0A3R8P049_9PSEU|nr:GPP34 family phosphoprotein [Saccharopolyspora rhizosphaerae]RRO13702.1 GPP34 family phosphoprotein [Saccharopolyspora rhizosphaerae]
MTTLSLPEEFVLLLHKSHGSYHATSDHTGAAELGELVLTDRVGLDGKKVTVLDAEPSGVGWIDEAVALLTRKAGAKNKPVHATTFIQHRSSARKQHAEALVERGLMHRERKKFLFFKYDLLTPDSGARDALIARIRAAARDEVVLDERLALLAALVHATGLHTPLGFDRAERRRLKEISKGEQLGGAVRDVIAQTTAIIATTTVIAVGAANS